MATIQKRKVWDAIVVGSGITGGWAAKELTEKGLEVLVLEAGRSIDPKTDFVPHTPPWQTRFRGLRDHSKLDEEQPIQKQCYACDELASRFFVNDKDNPYTQDEDKPFVWIRGRQVGGRSITWALQSYRWSDLDFEANARDGHGVDWPIRYADLAPWYDHVEDFVGISGEPLGLPQLPDSRFLPPMELNCAEQKAQAGIAQAFGGQRVLTIGRVAVVTRSHRGRPKCHYCGPCYRGCRVRSAFSSLNATLPAAAATGRLTLRPNSVVHSLGYDSAQGRVSSARVIDAESLETTEHYGKVFFVCASALESARLLLNSTSERFPHGLANSSGQVGRNLMDHLYGVGAYGLMPAVKGRPFGQRPNGCYVPRFRNLKNEQSNGFLRGYGFQGGGLRRTWEQATMRRGFGAELKHAVREGSWVVAFSGFGECLPREDNYVEIDPEVKDRWGVPVLRIRMTWGANEIAMAADIREKALELVQASGAFGAAPYGELAVPGLAIHEMGTARMGRDPETSVLNAHNQAHDVKNLFITDGACMASSACQNPVLTYMALTARACDYAVEEMGLGHL
jgi:choline dehydrogenase-like flavoprotein